MKLQIIAAAVGGLVLEVDGLGINCRGSGGCGLNGVPGNALQVLLGKVQNLASTQKYVEGQQIAGVNVGDGSCIAALYQKVGGRQFSQAQTVKYLQDLSNHGCKKCGSIPTDAGNDVKNGELTVNFVSVCAA